VLKAYTVSKAAPAVLRFQVAHTTLHH